MTWSEYACTADDLRMKEPDLLKNLVDMDVIELNQTQAKIDVYHDLVQVFGYESETDATLETLLETHDELMRETLAYRQLYWYFLQKGTNEAHISRRNTYGKLYSDKVKQFPSLKSNSGQHTSTRTMQR